MDHVARNDLEQSPFHVFSRGRIIRAVGTVALSAAIAVSASPVAAASGGESGAVTGAGFGPTLGVGDVSSYSGGSTSNSFCHQGCGSATIGVGGPSSYSGGSTANNPGGSATLGVGDVNSYTGGGTPGTAQNGTNATTRTGNYGPGHP
jgi:hypothetical protein